MVEGDRRVCACAVSSTAECGWHAFAFLVGHSFGSLHMYLLDMTHAHMLIDNCSSVALFFVHVGYITTSRIHQINGLSMASALLLSYSALRRPIDVSGSRSGPRAVTAAIDRAG